MSYNIDTVEKIAEVRPVVFADWPDDRREELPESNPLEDGQFHWSGCFSGHSYGNGTLRDFTKGCTGDATYLCTWEGGDSHTVIRIVDGEVFEHEAKFVAGDLKGKLT